MNAYNHTERAVRTLRVATTASLDDRIFADAAVALERATAGVRQPVRRGALHAIFASRALRLAAMIAVTAMVVTGGIAVWKSGVGRLRQTGTASLGPIDSNVPIPGPGTAAQLAAERQKIDALYAARDVNGLIQALDTSYAENKIVIAQHLGEIGDERAITVLSRLADQWQGDPAENPFARAIQQIEARNRLREPNAPDRRQEPQSRVVPEAKPTYVLTGAITDAETGEPIKGVQVQVVPDGGGRVYRVTTDSNGVYGLDRVDKDGPHNVLLNAPDHITPAEWERPREILQLQTGGQVTRDYSLERGGKLVITAVDEKGRPVKGVNVYAAYVSDDMGRGPRRPSRSDANGVVTIGGLRLDTYLVMAAHPEFALAGQKVALEEPNQVKSLMLDLKKGVGVAGVATCSDGLPADGWSIEAKPLWWNSVYSWPYNDPVAEDGTFILKHIVPGPHRLGVFIPEKGGSRGIWSTDVNLPPENGVLDLKIPKPSPHGRVSISGTVKFIGGSYEQGFWIHAASAEGSFGSTYLYGGKRDFTITDLVPGLYDLDITIAGQRREFNNIKAPAEDLVLEVAVPRSLRVSGRVIDAWTRRPVTSFELREVGQQEYRRISDPNGAFEVQSYGPECRVQVRADGYGDKITDNLYRDSNEPVLVELGPPVSISGVVVDEAGRPIEGATVNYRYTRSANEQPDAKYITSTDADGRFTADNLSTDDSWRWFVFRHPDYARIIKMLEFSTDRGTEVKIVLSKGGTVEGRLYDWQGKPLANTTIYFMDESHFPYWKQNRARLGSVTTDGDGLYRIEHLPEELCYAFREDPDNQLGVVQAAVVPDRGRTRRLDIGGPWKATGRLLKDGQPVANTPLLVTYEAGIAQGFTAYTVSDSDGRFAFYGLPTGQRSVYWAMPGMRNWDRWMTLGTFGFQEGVDLDLGDFDTSLAEVTVDLVMEDTAIPAEGWSVIVQVYDERYFRGRQAGLLKPRSDPAEPFVFSNISVGRHDALAQRQGYPTIRQPFEIKAGQSAGRVVVTVPAGSASISGKVTSGKVQQPRLMLRSVDEQITAEVQVNPDGTFEVKNLPAGRYIFGHAFAALERTSTLAEVTLGPQEHKTITIDADRADAGRDAEGYLVVVVVTQEGIPLATPSVWLERAGRVIAPQFDTDDDKSFAGDPGPCVLHAEYPGYRPVQTTVELKSKQGRTTQDILAPLVITMTR
jgi:hypothetical protein